MGIIALWVTTELWVRTLESWVRTLELLTRKFNMELQTMCDRHIFNWTLKKSDGYSL